MSNEFSLTLEKREDVGKGASRRLRRETQQVPVIIYGGQKAPAQASIPQKDIAKALENEAFYSHILTLELDGQQEQVILKDLQRHPAKGFIMHADFLRVSANQKITTHVPLHFINEDKSVGVKAGGVVAHSAVEVEVRCLPANLPEFIEVDMTAVDVGQSVHLSDLKLPEGVELVELSHGADHDNTVAVVQATRASADEGSADEETSAE
ncbi:50S ribosomal protein L25/general stress protein Ctc [Zooshikella ganghwensis]|uniref:Large ribosomal subunit protein bL25 n=1 Tax=Zooshikella ganghwensis TaxID=202772 RepID=A0A4V1IP16_9GAMM|nr:50S ribosomal protein L25/general stress protein Ctc [Zooshikella ganghwensis]RDH45661.1 50S ribosomal protein L25/general stress protein Ctc [Zooshikella ganghwensis]